MTSLEETAYRTGTVAVTTDGGVTVSGGIWGGPNVVDGDMVSVDGTPALLVSAVTDATHGQLVGWSDGVVSGKSYVAYKCSSLRFDDVQIAQDLQKQVAALNLINYFIPVPDGAAAPDPSLGDENQRAFQDETGKWWKKEGGVWVFKKSPYDSFTAVSDFFRGLGYSQNATYYDRVIDVAPGSCRDSLNEVTIDISATLSKNVTLAWSAGQNGGSLDAGVVANGFYHIHVIFNPTTGESDFLTSTSMTAPVMPSGFTRRRWIGAFSYFNNIYDFVALGEWHFYKSRPASVSSASNTTTATERLLAVPPGAKCEVEVYLQANDSAFFSGTVGGNVTIRDPDLGPYTPSASTGDWFYNPGTIFATRARLFTSNTGKVSTGDSNANGTGVISISTEGWRIDRSVYR
jgi:hypothetical protein